VEEAEIACREVQTAAMAVAVAGPGSVLQGLTELLVPGCSVISNSSHSREEKHTSSNTRERRTSLSYRLE
jgi:hypothetical protein